jgi:hypothetical protein
MDAVPKRDGPVLPPTKIEPVGISKLLGVAVRCAQAQNSPLAHADTLVADLELFGRDAAGQLDGAVVAQELRDGASGRIGQGRMAPLRGRSDRRRATGTRGSRGNADECGGAVDAGAHGMGYPA